MLHVFGFWVHFLWVHFFEHSVRGTLFVDPKRRGHFLWIRAKMGTLFVDPKQRVHKNWPGTLFVDPWDLLVVGSATLLPTVAPLAPDAHQPAVPSHALHDVEDAEFWPDHGRPALCVSPLPLPLAAVRTAFERGG